MVDMKNFEFGGPTILQSPFFVKLALPFLLMFTIVFAILQKSEVLGKGKKQMDALVALVIALIFVAFANAVQIVVFIIPVLGIGLVMILVFLLLWGSVYGPGEFKVHPRVQMTIGILAAIAVVGAVLWVGGWWDDLTSLFTDGSSGLFANIVIIVGIVIAVIVAWTGGNKKEDNKGNK